MLIFPAAYIADTAVFGYLLGGSLDVQTLEQTELTVAAAITAMGATRQARSHIKASLGVGNSIAAVQSMLDVANELVAWNGDRPLVSFNVEELARDVETELNRA